MISEFDLIKKIKKRFSFSNNRIVGIGDDCAVIKTKDRYLLYSIDSMVQNIHFNMKLGINWSDVGYKAVVRAISDIASMGGVPEYILIALFLRKDFHEREFKKMFDGIELAVKEYGINVLGGDITSSQTTAITISVIGSSKEKPALRKGAKTGDHIYVSGYTGLSSMGLWLLKKGIKTENAKIFIESYKRPKARVNLGTKLLPYISSMIDISDGLVGDLGHILEESKVGAIIEKEFLPLHDSFSKLPLVKTSKIYDCILNGGDDYELVFTANENHRGEIEAISKELNIRITRIGKIIDKGFFIRENGNMVPLKSRSYEHFRS
ncbi:MAG: thiamine-phosphate kinase [Proteobacteria bacterium]|nr:thiamine-phosphate kinase [Pseudomonadota bacterium]